MDTDSSVSSEIDWVGIGDCDLDDFCDIEGNEREDAKKYDIAVQKQTYEDQAKAGPSKPKRTKREATFNPLWKDKYSWLSECHDNTKAKCNICICEISVSHGGENDISKHLRSEKHRRNFNKSADTRSLKDIFVSSNNTASDIKKKRQIAECAFVYHSIQHSHSYLSLDCAGKLFTKIFTDSKITEKYACGRTKATKIAVNILKPETRRSILEDLKNDHTFAIATDASNKGNIKTFPLIVRYFNKNSGVNTKLLNFFSLVSEKSVDITERLLQNLNEAGLSVSNVTAYCADNASVNFGKTQSVIVELQKHNSKILPVGCLCHIIHNAGKFGQVAFRYDIELIVIKCYNEFSSSTKRTEKLKDFFEFCEEEWQELLRSVPTRWLSLVAAAERLLKNFVPVKSYFLSLESPPPILKQFFEDELAEAYLGKYIKYILQKNVCSWHLPF